MMASSLRREPLDELRRGDVIRWNGRPRTVRRVCRGNDGLLRYVVFAILRRSWTNRCTTTYTRSDLRGAYGGLIARRTDSLCATDVECLVQREVDLGDHDTQLIFAEQSVGRVW